MDLSTYIARIFGLYLIILSISLFINKNNLKSTITDIIRNSSMQFVLGLYMITVGLILVVAHNIWVSSWQVGVTILSWLILIKGILYTAFPQVIRKMTEPLLKSGHFAYPAIIINFLLGVYFCYVGFSLT